MAKQVGVSFGVSVDSASGAADDPRVLEISRQSIIESGEGTGAAQDRQGQNMAVIGHAESAGVESNLLLPEPACVDRAQPTRLLQPNQQSSHFGVLCQFLAELPCGYKPWVPPIPKKPAAYCMRLRQKLRRYVGIDNQAHFIYPRDPAPRLGRTAGIQAAGW